MAKSQQTFNKTEREKRKRKKQQEKRERREQRKIEKDDAGKMTFEEQIRYVDHNGNLTLTPPDPTKKHKIKVEDIVLGIPKAEDIEDQGPRLGRVKFFNEEKGFGFIVDVITKENVFVHINQCAGPLKENDYVNYEVENGPKGPVAVQVIITVAPSAKPKVEPKPDTEETKAEETKSEETKVEPEAADEKPENPTDTKPPIEA